MHVPGSVGRATAYINTNGNTILMTHLERGSRCNAALMNWRKGPGGEGIADDGIIIDGDDAAADDDDGDDIVDFQFWKKKNSPKHARTRSLSRMYIRVGTEYVRTHRE